MPSAIQEQEARMLKPLFILPALLLFAGALQQPAAPPAPSTIPAEAAHMVNPVKPTPESQARAKKMYGYDCAMCHGANGNGKGDITDLNPPPKDYTDPPALKDLPHRDLFSLIKHRNAHMPPDCHT